MGRSTDPIGFPYLTETELWLTGRWCRGGVALGRHGEVEQKVEMPRLLFGILAVLLVRARRDASRSKTWASRGFMTAEEIRSQLKLLGGVTVDAERVVHLIYRLREKLAALHGGTAAARRWAMQFVEYQEPLGYRLSTPPDRLHLDIIPDLPPPGEGQSDRAFLT